MGISKYCCERFKLDPVPIEGQIGTERLASPTKTYVSTCSQCPKTPNMNVKLPKGLIGAKCTALVDISGQECQCLIDTGSQVTTVPNSFHKQYLSDYPIHPLSDILEVEGANGLSVPYLGYVHLDITFPAEFIGVKTEVATVALIVPDIKSHTQPLVLVGTNTLDALYEEHFIKGHFSFLPALYGYRAILYTLELRHKRNETGTLGHVRMKSQIPEVLAAGQAVVLEGICHMPGTPVDKWVVVEHPTVSSLPGGVVVKCCLLTLPYEKSGCLPVVLINEADHDVTIPRRCVIADIHAMESVLSPNGSPSKSDSQSVKPEESKEPKIAFDFGDSPLSQEWRSRITNQLNKCLKSLLSTTWILEGLRK